MTVVVLALLVHTAAQLALPGFADRDAWFHSRYAALLAHGDAAWDGSSFPWITHSAYAARPTDWSLLFHWLLAPLAALLGPVAGLRTLAVLQAALLTALLHRLLATRGVRHAGAFTLLLVLASPQWLFRVHFGRPTPLVVASLLLVLHLALRRRRVAAALAACASLLLYEVPAPLFLVCGAAVIALAVEDRAAGRRPELGTSAALLCGGCAGILLHPGLWDGGLRNVWRLMAGTLDVAAHGGGIELTGGLVLRLALPDELGSPGVTGMLRELWPALLATVLATGAAVRAWRRGDGVPPAAAATTLLALAGLAATWRSGRFFEQWHVFALLAAGLTLPRPGPRAARVLGALVLLLAAVTAVRYAGIARRLGDDGGWQPEGAMATVHARARPGDVVWHLAWDDFAPLLFHAPDLRFVQGMDPWWCVADDAESGVAHAMIADGAARGDALRELLVSRFHARFVVLWSQPRDAASHARRERVAANLAAVPWAQRIHEDAYVTAFELSPR